MNYLPRKRKQRDTYACRPCRQRKVRCDGARPACRTCGRRNILCSYGEEGAAPQYTRHLPRDNGSLDWPSDGHNLVEDSRPEGNMLTVQGPVSGATRGQFFGDSSVSSLLQNIQDGTPGASASSVVQPAHEDEWPQTVSRLLKPMNRLEFEDFSLPPRPLSDHLVDCYWSSVHSLYPFIHKQTFLRGYSKLWEPEEKTRTRPLDSQLPLMGLGDTKNCPVVFYFALNSMFALGCQFSHLAGEDREEKSKVFLSRSNRLLRQIDLLDQGDLSLVQALLVNAHYLQSTPFADRCWNAIGLACRMAQGIGLHSTDHDSRWSDLELQMRRCVWHACVMLDLSTSMALGRPSMTSHHSRLPLPNVNITNLPGDHDPIVDDFFMSNTELHYIMGDILQRVYEPRHRAERAESLQADRDFNKEVNSAVKGLEFSLSSFITNIPPNLRWEPAESQSNQNQCLYRQRVVLHARYLHLRILLYRPTLSRFYRDSTCRVARGNCDTLSQSNSITPSNSTSSADLKSSLQCVDAALGLIQLLSKTSESDRPAWWFSVLYIFTAGVVLIIAQMCPAILQVLKEEKLETSWEQCLSFLDQNVSYSKSAKKCAQDLRKAYHLISSQQSHLAKNNILESSTQSQAPPEVIQEGNTDWYDNAPTADEIRQDEDTFLADILWDDFIPTIPLYF